MRTRLSIIDGSHLDLQEDMWHQDIGVGVCVRTDL